LSIYVVLNKWLCINPTVSELKYLILQKSALSNLIQEIEPLDVSLIQKDVPPTTVDAMKRTISGMLGLLPSDQFQVLIEALWESLSKLLVSSMMTGYVHFQYNVLYTIHIFILQLISVEMEIRKSD
jgi:hypothetical protein